MRTTTIHQVNYLPWLGFFNKIKNSDVFVMFDITDYEKNSIQNRNKIRTADGWCYLTIPINKICYRKPFYTVKMPANKKWKQNHWKAIELNYKKTDYFASYQDSFKEIYSRDYETLMELNSKIILYLLEQFDINVEIIKTTDLNLNRELKKTDMLVEILQAVKADTYLSGLSGKKYLEGKKFKRAGINLAYQNFKHPIYKQRYPGFELNMAAIDLLFNMGEKSKELI